MGSQWLVGSNGLFCGALQEGWAKVGPAAFPVNAILPRASSVVVGVEGGLWEVRDERWIQWHDETMTLVLGLAATDVDLGVVVASAYGIATGSLDENHVPRWQWYSDVLNVNARYSNTVVVDPSDSQRCLVGTEAGVWVCEKWKARWHASSLADCPVRSLIWSQDVFWAGADRGGVWRSVDGVDWQQAGAGLEDVPVYSLAWADDRFIAGTEKGIAVGDGSGDWRLVGPTVRMRAINASDSVWLAGASPGGLWFSENRGQSWQKTGNFNRVQAIVAVEGE